MGKKGPRVQNQSRRNTRKWCRFKKPKGMTKERGREFTRRKKPPEWRKEKRDNFNGKQNFR